MKALKPAILVLAVTVLGACGKSSGGKKANLTNQRGKVSPSNTCERTTGTDPQQCNQAMNLFRDAGADACKAVYARIYIDKQCDAHVTISPDLRTQIFCFRPVGERQGTAPDVRETINEAVCDDAIATNNDDGTEGPENDAPQRDGEDRPNQQDDEQQGDNQQDDQTFARSESDRLVFVRSQDFDASRHVIVSTSPSAQTGAPQQQQLTGAQQAVVRPSSGVITLGGPSAQSNQQNRLEYPASPAPQQRITPNVVIDRRQILQGQGIIAMGQAQGNQQSAAQPATVVAQPTQTAQQPQQQPAQAAQQPAQQQPVQLTTLTMERRSGAAPANPTAPSAAEVQQRLQSPSASSSEAGGRIQSPAQVALQNAQAGASGGTQVYSGQQVQTAAQQLPGTLYVTTLQNQPDGSTVGSVTAVTAESVPANAQYSSPQVQQYMPRSCEVIEKVNVEAKRITPMLSIAQQNYANNLRQWSENVCSQDRSRSRTLWNTIDRELDTNGGSLSRVSEESCTRELFALADACSKAVRDGQSRSTVFQN